MIVNILSPKHVDMKQKSWLSNHQWCSL